MLIFHAVKSVLSNQYFWSKPLIPFSLFLGKFVIIYCCDFSVFEEVFFLVIQVTCRGAYINRFYDF